MIVVMGVNADGRATEAIDEEMQNNFPSDEIWSGHLVKAGCREDDGLLTNTYYDYRHDAIGNWDQEQSN